MCAVEHPGEENVVVYASKKFWFCENRLYVCMSVCMYLHTHLL